MPNVKDRAKKFQQKQRLLYAQIMSKIEEINNATTELESIMSVATNAAGITQTAASDISIVEQVYNALNKHCRRLVTMKREITMTKMSSSNPNLNEDGYIAGSITQSTGSKSKGVFSLHENNENLERERRKFKKSFMFASTDFETKITSTKEKMIGMESEKDNTFERHLMKLKNHERKVPVEDNLSPFPSEEIVKLKEEANKAEIIGLKKNEVDLRAEIQILKTTAIQQEQRKQHDLKEIARLQDEAEKYKEENISLRTEMYTLLRELPLQDSKRHQLELKKTVKVEDTEIVNFKEQDSSQMAEIHSLKAASALQKQTHQNELEKTAGLEDEAAKSKAEILILKAEIYSLKRELQQERNRREEEIKSMQETQRMFLEYERKSSQEMMKTMMDGAESNRKRKRNDDENNTDAK